MSVRPPLVPRLVLRLVIQSERIEDVEGDLVEIFDDAVMRSGIWRARTRYWIETAGVLRRARQLRRAPAKRAREGSMTSTMSAAIAELKYAVRGLAKNPGYTAIAALTLGLGLGSTLAIFTVLNAVLLRPLPYADSDRIVEIVHYAPQLGLPEMRSSPGLAARYRETSRTLTHVTAHETRLLNLSGAGVAAERVRATAATPDLFAVLATAPASGRPFHAPDAELNAPLVVILSDAIWRSRFGADPGAIGRTVRLDGEPAEIVGVMPRGFDYPDAAAQIYVPLRLDRDAFGAFGMATVARLAPGASLDAARTEIAQLQQRIPEWFPDLTSGLLASFGWSSAVEPLHARVVRSVATTLWILLGTVGLVLLVAAANVANLFLVRAESRQREVAVRSALGASRGRVALMFLSESLVVATIGGALALIMADAATRLLVTYGPPRLPRLQEIRLDVTVLAFAAALSVLSAALLAMLPTLGAARRSFVATLRDGGRGNTSGRARHRVRQLLIVSQVAMALVLLVGAGLMLRSVVRLTSVDPGFRVAGLLSVTMSAGARPDRVPLERLYLRMLDEIATVPGVIGAGAAGTLPVGASSMSGSGFEVRSRPRSEQEPPLVTMHTAVTPGYFEALGTPVLEGRAPAPADADQRRPVAWVNRTFARQFLGNAALGESIRFDDQPWLEIVGVVGDLRTSGLADEVSPMVYLPLSDGQSKLDVMHAAVRTGGDPAAMAPAIRAALDRVDTSVPLTIRTMDDIVSASLAQTTFTLTLLTIAAGIGLLLGVVGLYGAISYIASQRTSEIGVRLALGARPSSVRAMVLRQGASVALGGIAVGLVAAWWSGRFMSSMLFEVSAHDPATYAGVALLLLVVSVVAAYVPARRAAAIDPVRALRIDG